MRVSVKALSPLQKRPLAALTLTHRLQLAIAQAVASQSVGGQAKRAILLTLSSEPVHALAPASPLPALPPKLEPLPPALDPEPLAPPWELSAARPPQALTALKIAAQRKVHRLIVGAIEQEVYPRRNPGLFWDGKASLCQRGPEFVPERALAAPARTRVGGALKLI
jgi:hypothetical protein